MSRINLENLYKLDDLEWLEKTITLLKKQQFNQLDIEHFFVQIKTQQTLNLPPECPYRLEQLLDIHWLPPQKD
ncbi:DUF29 family protein [Spirulina subsalsa]|uniref:DUF29 family protein n=1 Tax=Spirulina subsalsa TaxID=54311 RepID=UPI00031CCC7F|nr:DUF29 family protein [Spirulina subsalsa]